MLHQKRIEEMTKQNHMTQNWWWRRLNFVINDEVMGFYCIKELKRLMFITNIRRFSFA